MNKILIIILIITFLAFLVYLKIFMYAFGGEICGGPTIFQRRCLPGYECVFPHPPTGIDTDMATCKKI